MESDRRAALPTRLTSRHIAAAALAEMSSESRLEEEEEHQKISLNILH